MGLKWLINLYIFFMTVQPTVKAVIQLVLAPVESNVLVQCIVEAYPKPLNTWYRHEGKLAVTHPHPSFSGESAREFFNFRKWLELFYFFSCLPVLVCCYLSASSNSIYNIINIVASACGVFAVVPMPFVIDC